MKKKRTLFDYFLYFLMTVLAFFTIAPFYNVLILSVADTVHYAKHIPYMLPHTINFAGFQEVMSDPYFIKSMGVTLFLTVVGTVLNMLFSVSAAYVLSREKFLGRTFFLKFIIFTMLFSGGMVPTYLLVTELKLLNTVWSMIFPCLINTYYVIIMKNYFQTLPESFQEAAIIDGANDLQILLKIYLPISKPFLATFTLFYAVERWNEWWHSYLYVIDKDLKPLQIYLKDVFAIYNTQLAPQLQQQLLERQSQVFPQSVQMATIVITMVPIMCVYPFIQKHFVKGITSGGTKE